MWPSGPLDQRDAEARCLTYTTAVLGDDVEVVGEPRIELRASSSAVDTDFIATLSDVHESGYSEIVRQSGIRGRRRGGPSTTELLTPGEVATFPIAMTQVAHRFKAGHRIRLTIASSSFPNFLPNAGTAEEPYLATKAVKATNAVHHDAANPSTLTLPVHAR
jgi:putative CocE/NonD family hydrolase